MSHSTGLFDGYGDTRVVCRSDIVHRVVVCINAGIPRPHSCEAYSYTPSTIDLQINSRDEPRLLARHKHTRIRHIIHLPNPAHWHITNGQILTTRI
jgi:hypothetical protein